MAITKQFYKVVATRGGFVEVPLTFTKAFEAQASKRERQKLVRSVGLDAEGNLPGLLRRDAKRLAKVLNDARVRNAARNGQSTKRVGRRV